MKLRVVLLAILAATLVLYLPVILNPEIILNRGNDLEEFFWPIVHYVKQQILVHHTFPLWNNLFLSGTPLLPDPQSPLFYPPNLIFLLLPLEHGFLILFTLHTFFGGLGIYFACQRGLHLSRTASTLAAVLYITAPKLAGYLEAGHVGLIYTLAWFPYSVWASIEIAKGLKIKWALLLAISLAGLYYTHAITFAIAAVGSCLLVLTTTSLTRSKSSKVVLFLVISALLTFGLIAVQLLPQLEWLPHTTRPLLLQNRDVYPKWETKGEFLKMVFVPWASGTSWLWQRDTEKLVTLGALPSTLAVLGFLKLKRKYKTVLLLVGSLVLLLALNNVSPTYNLLLTQNWYVLMRVSTRVSVVLILIIVFLAGYTTDKFGKTRWGVALAVLAVAESLFLSWVWLSKPIPNQTGRFVPEEVYQFLVTDSGRFRVFCVTRCLSQRKAAEYNLELVEGYSTLQQKNYFDHFIQLSQVYWDTYTLSLPPFEIYHFQKLQPHPPTLADLNIKYIISPHELTSPGLSLEKKVEQYLIYRNNLVQPRAYFLNNNAQPAEAIVLEYAPNRILIDTSPRTFSQLVLAEVVSPGWAAFLDGKEETPIDEYQKIMRLVNLKPETMFVEFRYLPPGYNEGKLITVSTLIFLLGYITGNNLLLRFKQSKNRSQKKDSVNIRPN